MAEISRSLNHEISRREGDMKALQKLQQRMGATGALENRFADVQNTVDQLLTKLKAKARGVLSAVRAAPAGKPSAPSRRGSTGSGSIMDRLLDAASKPGSAHSVKAKPTKQLPEVKLTTKPDHRAAAPGTPAAPIPFHENSKRVQSITVDLSNEGMARQATEPEKAKTHWVEIDEPEIRHRPIGPVVNDEVRIIVAGSRDYHNHANICETLDRIKDRAQAPVRIIDGPYYTGYGRPTGGYKAADSAPPAAPAPAPETAAKPAQAKTGSMMDQMLKKAAYQAPDEDTTRHAWGTNETQANDGPSRFKGGIGAAYLANQWAHMNNVTSTTYRANWEEDRDNARFQRNQRMLDHGRPHLVVAFLSGPEDPLTEHMVQIADKAGVPIEMGCGSSS